MPSKMRFACALMVAFSVLLALYAPASSADYVVGWEDAILVEDYDLGSAFDPESATDGEGNVMAVWSQSGDSGFSIYASLYTVGEGWSDGEALEDSDTEARDPLVAMNEAGDAVAVWQQWNETTSIWNFWVNRYVSDIGWEGAEPIKVDGSLEDRYPDVVMDSQGNAVLVWVRLDVPTDVMMSRYDAGAGWSEPTAIDGSAVADALYPSIGIDEDDDLIVAWIQYEMSEPSTWARRYEAAEGWSDPVKLGDTGMYGKTVLSVGEGGDAACAWSHLNDSSSEYEVWSSVYQSGVGWDESVLIDYSPSPPDPQVAIDRDGNAVLLWWTFGGIGDGMYCRSYEAGVGWGDIVLVASSYGGSVSRPEVAMNGNGDALCVFDHYDGVMHNLRGAVYSSDGWWAPSVQINEQDIGGINYYALTINDDGSGQAVWDQSDGSRSNVWSARYLAPDETPPSVVISSPQDDSSVDSSTVTVTGQSEPGATVSINGVVAAVEPDGSFACSLALIEGENTITATATDPAGNSASTSVTVNYEAQDEPSADDLAEVVALLNETMEMLNETMAQLDQAKAELNGTADDLAGALEDLDDANGRIDALSSQVMALTALLVVVVLLVAVMSALYLSLRKRLGAVGPGPEEGGAPPPE
jgi:uncharacterized protein YheU (UPF0270 family)